MHNYAHVTMCVRLNLPVLVISWMWHMLVNRTLVRVEIFLVYLFITIILYLYVTYKLNCFAYKITLIFASTDSNIMHKFAYHFYELICLYITNSVSCVYML